MIVANFLLLQVFTFSVFYEYFSSPDIPWKSSSHTVGRYNDCPLALHQSTSEVSLLRLLEALNYAIGTVQALQAALGSNKNIPSEPAVRAENYAAAKLDCLYFHK